MIQFKCTILFTLLALSMPVFSQTTYPKITTYVGVVHPIISFSKEEPTVNFKEFYSVGFPTGINIWKNPKIGFSFEIVPSIKAENGSSKMNSLLFHPGVLIALGNGYTFAGRAAFETTGRYGITPVFNKTIKKNDNSSYYVAIPLPVRFGNNAPTTFTLGFQFGIAF